MLFVNVGTCRLQLFTIVRIWLQSFLHCKRIRLPERHLEGDDNVQRQGKVTIWKDSGGPDCILHKRKLRGDLTEVAKLGNLVIPGESFKYPFK